MNRKELTLTLIYVTISLLLLIGIVLYCVLKKHCKCKAEGFNQCVCKSSGSGRGQACQNVDKVWADYENGITETNPNWAPRKWSTVSPGDVNFPPSNGCGWSTQKPAKWIKWDFTDFGSDYVQCGNSDGSKYPVENYSYDCNQAYEGTAVL